MLEPRLVALIAVTALVAAAPSSSGEVVNHAPSGLQFALPEGWTTRTEAGQLVAEASDRKVALRFTVIEETAARDYVATWSQGRRDLTNLQVDVDGEVSQVNGLQHVVSAGSATMDGKPVDWDVTIVKGARKALAIVALGQDLDAAVVQAVYSTIRRQSPGPGRIKGHGPDSTGSPEAPVEGDESGMEEEEQGDTEPPDENPPRR
jgi:predicted Zn-dependent protease